MAPKAQDKRGRDDTVYPTSAADPLYLTVKKNTKPGAREMNRICDLLGSKVRFEDGPDGPIATPNLYKDDSENEETDEPPAKRGRARPPGSRNVKSAAEKAPTGKSVAQSTNTKQARGRVVAESDEEEEEEEAEEEHDGGDEDEDDEIGVGSNDQDGEMIDGEEEYQDQDSSFLDDSASVGDSSE